MPSDSGGTRQSTQHLTCGYSITVMLHLCKPRQRTSSPTSRTTYRLKAGYFTRPVYAVEVLQENGRHKY